MNTAMLREGVLDIYRSEKVASPFGGWNTEWHKINSYRCGQLNQSMNYQITEDEFYHPEYKTFIVRHYADILPTDQVEYLGVRYDITSVEYNKYFNNKVIKCEKVKQ